MFDTILALFRKDAAPAPLPAPDEKLALGALLVRMAKADRAYLFEEVAQIDKILALRNGLSPVEAAKMRATCEQLESALPEGPGVIEILRDATSLAEREDTIQALWSVSLADGLTQESEQALMADITRDLGISPETGAALRAAAEAQRDV